MLSETGPRKLPRVVGWVKLAGRSFVAAGLIAAAQLGAAQALGLLVWSTAPTPDVWRRQLTWLLFIFAAAVLGGVAGGRRSVRAIRQAIANRRADAAAARHSGLVAHKKGMRAARRRAVATAKDKTVDKARRFAAGASRVIATVFAVLGAAAAFTLVWLSARQALEPADLRVMATTAGIGIAVGAVVSLLSLAAAPIAANAAVWLGGVWMFGLASVGISIASDRPTVTPRLGVLDAPNLIGPDEWWLGPNLMVAVAALFGFAVAATARWVGTRRLTIALSGLAGPAIVAAGYLVVGPAGELMSSYVAALLAATVGLLTSAATAAAHRSGEPAAPPQPAALTSGAAAVTARAPLAIESGRAALYPAAAPYPAPAAAAQYSASPYPTDQSPTTTGRKRAGRATTPSRVDAPRYPATEPVYVAPPRSAPVAPARVSAPVPVQRPTPAPPPQPTPPPAPPQPAIPAAGPARLPEPFSQPPAAAPPTKPATSAKTTAKPPAKTAAKRAAPAPAAVTLPAKPSKSRRRGKADAPASAPPVRAEPVRHAKKDMPRTTRPAEVVAVAATQPSLGATSAAAPEPKGRRARRRAARLAAERAEIQARLDRQMERDAKAMGKREREHVDWVKHLVSLPDDPTLTTRRK